MPPFDDAAGRVAPADAAAAAQASARQDLLSKPSGSLGALEAAGVQLAAIGRRCPPPVPDPAVLCVFAADHGVLAEGVSPWPQEMTVHMVTRLCAGDSAGAVLARQLGVGLRVVDVGLVTAPPPSPALVSAPVRRGTQNMAKEHAMSIDEARRSLDVGASVAADAVAAGARCLLAGDVGVGNTTPAAALVAAFTGRDPAGVTGRGSGIGDERWAHKVSVVERALARPVPADPVAVLASVGGLEIAALTGYLVGGAAAGVPVILDGVATCAAALAAVALVPDCVGYLLAGHRSSEPGAAVALAHLGLAPLLDLGLHLGEGTGACLALPLAQAATGILAEMAAVDPERVSRGSC